MAEDLPSCESEDLNEDYPTVTDGVRRPSYDQGKGPRKGSMDKPDLKHTSPGKSRKGVDPSVSFNFLHATRSHHTTLDEN